MIELNGVGNGKPVKKKPPMPKPGDKKKGTKKAC